MKKFISWNVNGIRACIKKGFLDVLEGESPDYFAVQETKMQEGQEEILTNGYHQYWNSAKRKGYSGTLVLSKEEAVSTSKGIGIEEHDEEGRVVTADFKDFYLVNVYVPNSKPELARLDYRQHWEDDFRDYVVKLNSEKPVIICGDLNVAHTEIDLKNPKTNRRNPGFTDEEREKFTELLEAGFTDTFRYKYPDKEGAYTWWSYRFNARKNNAGWRIDYFLVSNDVKDKIEDAKILSDVYGSDHCPVVLELDI